MILKLDHIIIIYINKLSLFIEVSITYFIHEYTNSIINILK